MRVDEAGRHNMSLGVDFFFSRAYVFADRGNFVAVDRDVSLKGRAAGAVDDRSVLDHYIVSHNRIVLPCGRSV